VLLFTVEIAGVAHADQLSNRLQIRPELSLAGMTNYHSQNGVSTSYDTVAATAELTIYSEVQPDYGGVFVDYRYSMSSRIDDNLNLGGYFRYNLPSWDSTTWLFANQSQGNSATWLYATRLRYRVTENYKLGVEAMAPIDDAGALDLMLGNYSSVSDSLSLNILADAGARGAPDLAVRMELSWQIH
jgi:hypothetical protein